MHEIGLLQHFYASALGQRTAGEVNALLQHMHHPKAQDIVAALGYGAPYLDADYLNDTGGQAPYKLALMPALLGTVLKQSHPQCLVQSHLLPLADASIYSLILVHALEHEADPKAVLREAWRVVQDDGHLLLVLPHRSGLWSRGDDQPFGQGTPYNHRQINRLLRRAGFAIKSTHRCLFFPPTNQPLLLRFGLFLQPVIRYLLPMLAGVMVIHAHKTLLHPTPVGKKTPTFADQVAARPQQQWAPLKNSNLKNSRL